MFASYRNLHVEFIIVQNTIFKILGMSPAVQWLRHQVSTARGVGSVPQSCPTLCDPMNCSMPGLPVHHHLPEFSQTHIHRVGDAIQPSHPLSSHSAIQRNSFESVLMWWMNLEPIMQSEVNQKEKNHTLMHVYGI